MKKKQDKKEISQNMNNNKQQTMKQPQLLLQKARNHEMKIKCEVHSFVLTMNHRMTPKDKANRTPNKRRKKSQ